MEFIHERNRVYANAEAGDAGAAGGGAGAGEAGNGGAAGSGGAAGAGAGGGGALVAEVTFPDAGGGAVDINHTFVDESLRGQGVAAKLMQEAYDEIKAQGKKAVATCPYAVAWFERNPGKRDILR
jgi:predicted GNAT family acetyltransferase